MQKPDNLSSELSDYRWTLVSASDVDRQVIDDLQAEVTGKDALTLSFDVPLTHLTISNACNLISAPVILQNDTLRVGLLVSTQMACDVGLMARDKAAAAYFHGDLEVRFIENRLLLQTTKGAQLWFQGTPTAQALYGKGTRLFLEIAPQTKSCEGVGQMDCLYVRPIEYNEQGIQTRVGEWMLFYDRIEGYTHVAGQTAILRVNRFERANPVPADASRYIYQLDMVVSQSILSKD